MFSSDYKRGWLRGFFDSEGGAYWYDFSPEQMEESKHKKYHRGKHHSHKVEACNTEPIIIETAKTFLSDLGIKYRTRLNEYNCNEGRKPVWRIEIQKGPDIAKFAELVGFSSG